VLISYDFLKEAYTQKKDFTNALKYSEKYNVLYKELYGTENSNRIFELQKENAEEISNNLINKLKNEKKLSELKSKQNKTNNWLIGIISLLLIGGIISYFKNLRKKQKQKNETQKQQLSHELLQMEMTALRSRMNPHFLFNSLNSIKSFITQNEPRAASNYLSKFATLVRMILDHSKEKTISLNDELKAIQYYVAIEKMRLKNTFECKLAIDKSIQLDEILMPPSILQPFVENAIWHGFANSKEKGILSIRVFPKNNAVIIEIEDNGIGRKNAAKFSLKKEKRKSSGTKIIENTVKVYKAEKLVDLSIETVDLHNNGIAKGTKVIITIKQTNG
jgi:sensor histidine kinase YesM